ncbi:MAG: response regulator [Anaerolineae bacterium]|nr:response regulator [Anaerolineae bacterium]
MNEKILVVDDDSAIRRVVVFTLQPLDMDIIGARDGREALALAEQEAFSLAIVDINLPDMDGFEVVRQLKSLAHMQQVPIIMFTARNDRDDEMMAIQAGAVNFLYKPFSTQELRGLVKSYLVGM